MGGEPRELTGLDRSADSAQTLLGAWLLASSFETLQRSVSHQSRVQFLLDVLTGVHITVVEYETSAVCAAS